MIELGGMQAWKWRGKRRKVERRRERVRVSLPVSRARTQEREEDEEAALVRVRTGIASSAGAESGLEFEFEFEFEHAATGVGTTYMGFANGSIRFSSEDVEAQTDNPVCMAFFGFGTMESGAVGYDEEGCGGAGGAARERGRECGRGGRCQGVRRGHIGVKVIQRLGSALAREGRRRSHGALISRHEWEYGADASSPRHSGDCVFAAATGEGRFTSADARFLNFVSIWRTPTTCESGWAESCSVAGVLLAYGTGESRAAETRLTNSTREKGGGARAGEEERSMVRRRER
ncbi:hypothetical protein B0H19DRAFT_1232171 [Mycena capillaripes]|nr:hypothetical protein B0H19DRAFT_1232171 [Mycena capillaripes]